VSLNGLIIAKGNATGSSGGGLSVTNTSLSLTNTTLFRQLLGLSPGPSGLGGAGTVPCP
jgi:hypothetical protein